MLEKITAVKPTAFKRKKKVDLRRVGNSTGLLERGELVAYIFS